MYRGQCLVYNARITKDLNSKLLWLTKCWLFIAVGMSTICQTIGVGYSYSHFVGPVSGPERKMFIHNTQTGVTEVDYIAKPQYQFAYGVKDDKTNVLQNREETRNGDAVQGAYSVADPDGTLRVVEYQADNLNGFQAKVITDGAPYTYGGTKEYLNNWFTQTHIEKEQPIVHSELPNLQQNDEDYNKSESVENDTSFIEYQAHDYDSDEADEDSTEEQYEEA